MLKVQPYFIFIDEDLNRIYSTEYAYKLKEKSTGKTFTYSGVTSVRPTSHLIDAVSHRYEFIYKKANDTYNPFDELVASSILKK